MEPTSRMERNQLITYYFNRNDGEVIPSAHIEELEEAANKRIFEMIQEGYHSGELCESISLTDDDPEDGVEYSGWWDVEEVEPKEDKTEVPPSVYIGPSLLEANLKCASGNCTCHAEKDDSVNQAIIDALTHASMSYHHPSCKCADGFPENRCTCHVQKAVAALEKLKKD